MFVWVSVTVEISLLPASALISHAEYFHTRSSKDNQTIQII